METKLTIKNFRVFNEEGVIFEVCPLTILTGCNSSGKSSIVKAQMILLSVLNQIQENKYNVDLGKIKVDFSRYPMNLLGRFDKVLHKGSALSDITMEYTTYSYMLSKDVTVQFVFSANENDELNNGYLKSVQMRTKDGIFYSTESVIDNVIYYVVDEKLNNIAKESLDFMYIEGLMHQYIDLQDIDTTDGLDDDRKGELERIVNLLNSEVKKDKNRCRDISILVHYYSRILGWKSVIEESQTTIDILTWSRKNGSLYYIPVLEELNKLSKKDIKSFVLSLIDTDERYNDEGMRFNTNKILDDFLKSDATTFSQYFRSKEVVMPIKANSPTVFSPLQFNWNEPHIYSIDLMPLCEGKPARKMTEEELEPERKKSEKEWKEELEIRKESPITFHLLYDVVMMWNRLFSQQVSSIYYKETDIPWYEKYHQYYPSYTHTIQTLFFNFIEKLKKEIFSPQWATRLIYVASSRASIDRLYRLDSADDFSHLLKTYFDSKMYFQKHHIFKMYDGKVSYMGEVYNPDSFMNDWIKKFGIGEKLSLVADTEGLGVQLRLFTSPDDKEGHLLADEGYGITQLVSLLLQIEVAILSSSISKFSGISTYGLRPKNEEIDAPLQLGITNIAVEEPEIHLHPKYQSLLADMFVDAYKKFNIHFIIETHSEYLIRRLQILVAKKVVQSKNASILYVYGEKDRPGYEPQVKRIVIRDDGQLDGQFGEGFFDEADNLSMDLLMS